MSLKIFITGTDTNVGKTHISTGLLKYFSRLNYRTLGLKPLATGCIEQAGLLYSEDAKALQAASRIQLDYTHINPFAFAPPIAPHLAAKQLGIHLTTDLLIKKCETALSHPADLHVIEGVGGWLVPLNSTQTMADFAIKCQFSVILVVAIRLGCLNHALLTWNAIKTSKLQVIGWIANCIEPDQIVEDELIHTLKEWLPMRCLGVIQYNEKLENILTNVAWIEENVSRSLNKVL